MALVAVVQFAAFRVGARGPSARARRWSVDLIFSFVFVGDAFSLEEKNRNFKFYDPLTTDDASLSSCVEAIVDTEIGDIEKAVRYGMAALLMDLADVGGNVRDGCHIASMSGTWMTLVYGLGGMRDDDGTLSFWPRRASQDNAILGFRVTYRDQLLEVKSRYGERGIYTA
jgi:alpha,alpha-trehalose phosphorylase